MNLRSTCFITLALIATACSRADMAALAPEVQGEGPCRLLTTAEVQRAFPGSKAGRVDRSQEKNGVVSCLWDYPTGRFSIITGTDAPEPAKAEARGWTLIFLDPLRNDAERHVRYESLAGVGDEAIAIVEPQDKAKGFIQNGAILVVRRAQQQVSAMSTDLARRERGEALQVFADLGRAIAKRLE